MFLPGLSYYLRGKKNKKDNKLIKSAFIFHFIGGLILVLFVLLIIVLTILAGGLDIFGTAFISLYFFPIVVLLFFIGSLLLFINWIRSRNVKSSTHR